MGKIKMPHWLKEPYDSVDSKLSPSMWRWIVFWNSVSYLSLLVVTAWMFSGRPFYWPEPIVDLPLSVPLKMFALVGSVLWGVWYWVFVVQYSRWEKKIGWKAISFGFAILLAFGFSWIHPAYMFLLFNLFGVAFGVLPAMYSVPVILFSGVVMFFRIVLPFGLTAWAFKEGIWILAYALIMVVLGLWIRAAIQNAQEQQRMKDELAFTQGELAKQEREAGKLAERQRIAGAIHDTLAQDLTSIVMHLEAAEQALTQQTNTAQEHLLEAKRVAREGLSEARRFVWALQPNVTNYESLPAALERIVQQWQQTQGINVLFVVEGKQQPLIPPVEGVLLRAVQEGLTNIKKHAAANAVNLTLTYLADEVCLDVQDNGVGFSPDHPENAQGLAGFGLFSLREQARALGGQLEVESEPGQGTTLVLQIPLLTEINQPLNGAE